MTTNRLIIALLSLTALMQAVIIYRGYGTRSNPAAQPAVRDAPATATIDLTGLPVEGEVKAKLVLIEFSDYECPFCKRHASTVGKQLHDRFVATGRLRHAFANNPLAMHPKAKLFATAAICAGQQNAYWKMSDRIFSENSNAIENSNAEDRVTTWTRDLGLDRSSFQQCLSGPDPNRIIERDMQKAKDLALSGTPSFALGRVDSANQVHLEKIIVGSQPLEIFEKAINEELEKTARL